MRGLIFDTETTGFNEPALVEAAYIHCDLADGIIGIGGRFNALYNPGKPISCGAMATHHIMDEDVADLPPASSFTLPEGVEYLIGHNVDYDWGVIGKPDLKRICTLALSRMVWPEVEHSQSALMYFLERRIARDMVRNAHSAAVDVNICSIILGHLVRSLGVLTMEELWEQSEKARIPTVINFGKHKGSAIKDLPGDYVSWLLRQTDVDPYLRVALTNR